MRNGDKTLLPKARELYLRSLKFDSTYIEPCIGMGWIYHELGKTGGSGEQINYLDTGIMWADRALRYIPLQFLLMT